jgi:hypothetical protein
LNASGRGVRSRLDLPADDHRLIFCQNRDGHP